MSEMESPAPPPTGGGSGSSLKSGQSSSPSFTHPSDDFSITHPLLPLSQGAISGNGGSGSSLETAQSSQAMITNEERSLPVIPWRVILPPFLVFAVSVFFVATSIWHFSVFDFHNLDYVSAFYFVVVTLLRDGAVKLLFSTTFSERVAALLVVTFLKWLWIRNRKDNEVLGKQLSLEDFTRADGTVDFSKDRIAEKLFRDLGLHKGKYQRYIKDQYEKLQNDANVGNSDQTQ